VSSSPVLAAVAAPLLAGRGGDTAVEEAANGGSRRTGAGGQATGNEGTEIEEGRTIHGSTGGGQARLVAQYDTWGLDRRRWLGIGSARSVRRGLHWTPPSSIRRWQRLAAGGVRRDGREGALPGTGGRRRRRRLREVG